MMFTTVILSLAILMAVSIIVIGFFYLLSPRKISGSFGLKPPASGPDTTAWLRLKGIRDIASGLVVLALMQFASSRSAGLALLAGSVTPLGDMAIILGSRGSKSTALSVHGVTCAAMVIVGLLLTYGA